jgi:hypothetical protein
MLAPPRAICCVRPLESSDFLSDTRTGYGTVHIEIYSASSKAVSAVAAKWKAGSSGGRRLCF